MAGKVLGMDDLQIEPERLRLLLGRCLGELVRREVAGLDDRPRWSLALTSYTSEFAKLRLQVNQKAPRTATVRTMSASITSVMLKLSAFSTSFRTAP